MMAHISLILTLHFDCSYVKQVQTQVMRGDQRGGEEKRIADEFKAREEKRKELEQKALL